MSLENLLGKTLERTKTDEILIQRLLAAAKRNIGDAHHKSISTENRFDMSYKAIMQLANAALQANGYRALSSVPGHHMTMIQTLGQTIGLDRQRVIVLDALRKQRNVVDYSGDIIPESAAKDCLKSAEELLQDVTRWLEKRNLG